MDLVESLARLERLRKRAAARGFRAGYAMDQSRLIRLAHLMTAIKRHEDNRIRSS
jgi:hypothetical protein